MLTHLHSRWFICFPKLRFSDQRKTPQWQTGLCPNKEKQEWGSSFKPPHSCSLSIPSAFILLPEISDPIPEVGCGQSPQKAIIMMPYLSCKKIENDVYNFPTWQYCKYKDIFDSRIIINSTAKFYISISYQKDLLSIDTRIFTPSTKRKTPVVMTGVFFL